MFQNRLDRASRLSCLGACSVRQIFAFAVRDLRQVSFWFLNLDMFEFDWTRKYILSSLLLL